MHIIQKLLKKNPFKKVLKKLKKKKVFGTRTLSLLNHRCRVVIIHLKPLHEHEPSLILLNDIVVELFLVRLNNLVVDFKLVVGFYQTLKHKSDSFSLQADFKPLMGR